MCSSFYFETNLVVNNLCGRFSATDYHSVQNLTEASTTSARTFQETSAIDQRRRKYRNGVVPFFFYGALAKPMKNFVQWLTSFLPTFKIINAVISWTISKFYYSVQKLSIIHILPLAEQTYFLNSSIELIAVLVNSKHISSVNLLRWNCIQ